MLPFVSILVAVFLPLITGKTPEVLTRVGIFLQMFGVLAVGPDIIGEKRLGEAFSDVQGYRKAQQYIKDYLDSSEDTPIQESRPFLVNLSLIGNLIICYFMIFLSVFVITYTIEGYWIGTLGKWIGIGLSIAFAWPGIESFIWIVLLLRVIKFRWLANRMPNLFSYFIGPDSNSLIPSLGVQVSAALAYVINGVIPFLIYAAKIPIRKTIAIVTMPFIILGALLQFAATFF